MSAGQTVPILRMFDDANARGFYVDFLGFTIDWVHRFEDGAPLYMQVSKDGCVLQLSEHDGDSVPGAAVRIEVSDVDAYQHELLAKRYTFARPDVQEASWGSRDMSIRDPFGNKLIFTNSA